jgi:hypothetical protein
MLTMPFICFAIGAHITKGVAIEVADWNQYSWSLELHCSNVIYFLPQ